MFYGLSWKCKFIQNIETCKEIEMYSYTHAHQHTFKMLHNSAMITLVLRSILSRNNIYPLWKINAIIVSHFRRSLGKVWHRPTNSKAISCSKEVTQGGK